MSLYIVGIYTVYSIDTGTYQFWARVVSEHITLHAYRILLPKSIGERRLMSPWVDCPILI